MTSLSRIRKSFWRGPSPVDLFSAAYQPVGTGSFPRGAPCMALMVLPLEGNLEEMAFSSDEPEGELLVPQANIIVQERKGEMVQ